ncbi:MAG: thiamine diphosphokinase [Xanthomonadaceae bacterium]|nr:thiamine diphosphokinase [Xanthomonadaceae bacterium]
MKFILVGPRFNSKDATKLKKLNAPWIAVDGGLDFIKKIGIEPLFAIGDWDSLKNKKLLKHCDHITLPVRKDRNDLYYALEALKGLDPSEVHLFGFDLGRLDHEMSNLFEISAFIENNQKIKVIYLRRDEQLHFVSQAKHSLNLKQNQIVSFFSMGEKPARDVSLTGFEYALKGETLYPSSHALSNRAIKKKCQISVATGVLMIVINQ